MSYAFKKIGATNMLETAPNNANVVCEVNGEVNRVPATKIGGGGIKVVIIKHNIGSGYSCDNMTYEETVEYLTNGVPFLIFIFDGAEYIIADLVSYDGTSVINIMTAEADIKWTSAGFAIAGAGGGVM